MATPLISIYIPTHNRPSLLARAVDSIRSQDYSEWELIIVNDHSTSGTENFLKSLSDRRIRVIENPVPMGSCISRNLAITAASGEFITGLDDDDYFHPSRLSEFRAAWHRLSQEKRAFGFLYDDAVVLGPNGSTTRRHFVDIADEAHLNGYNCVGSQVFCRRTDMISAGMFSPSMPAWQDWELWVRLARKAGKGINIKRATYIVDESHDHDRISQKPAYALRYAAEQFLHRNKQLSAAERASVAYTLSNYAQVGTTLNDWLRMTPILSSKVLFWEKLGRKLFRDVT